MSHYELVKKYMTAALEGLRILAGDEVGPSNASWQDVAGTTATNLRCLADVLDELRQGAGPVAFPSPQTLAEEHDAVVHADGSSCPDGCGGY